MRSLAIFWNDLKKIWNAMTPRARKIAAVLAGLFAVILVIRGCAGSGSTQKDDAIFIRTVKVAPQDMKITLDYVGDIKAEDEAMVYPKVGGKVIEKIKEDGSRVAKGDVILYIDRDEVGFKFEKAPVESPLTGVVGRVYVDIGTQVTPQTPVAFVADMDKVEILLNIPEKYLSKVSVGQTAEVFVDAYPEDSFTGVVTKVSPVVDLGTRTFPLEIDIENADERLKPGMFAEVRLAIGLHKNAMVVMKEAILGRGDYAYVYVLEGDVVRKKKVKLGPRQGACYAVTEGLLPGEEIVVMGQQRLRDGAAVKVEKGFNGSCVPAAGPEEK